MPHLTPMNWILAMLMIWTLISMMNSMFWWSSPMSLTNKNKSTGPQNTNTWKWS